MNKSLRCKSTHSRDIYDKAFITANFAAASCYISEDKDWLELRSKNVQH